MPPDRSDVDPHFDYKNGILKNLPGFSTQSKLDRFEAAEAAEALVRLMANPIQGTFDSSHLREIHSRIFERVYPWAGEFRQVNIHRP